MKKSRLFLLILFIIGYIFLFSYYVKNYRIDKKNPNVFKTIADSTTVDKIEKYIVDNNLRYLDDINKSFTPNELTNQEKLKFAYLILKDESDFSKGVSYTKFQSKLESIFGSKITFDNEDIIGDNKTILVEYDPVNEVYIKNNIDSLNVNYSVYDYTVEYINNMGNYIIKVNKFFCKDGKVYKSVDDLESDESVLFTFNDEFEISQYITENYSDLKNNLSFFQYTFGREKGNIVLVEYTKLLK